MKTFQTTTMIAPIVSVGTYWGPFSYESLWEDAEQMERENDLFVCSDYSREKFGEALAAEATGLFAHERPFKELGVKSIKATEFRSPHEYNFCDDWLDLSFEVEDDFLDRAERKIFDPKYEKRFKSYIEEHWCSRDGFISSMPATSLNEMHEVFRQLREDDCGIDDMRCFGSVIALLYQAAMQDGELDDLMTGRLFERFGENHTLDEFCTVMDLDEAEEKYTGVKELLALPVKRSAELAEGLRKYLESDVSEAGKDRAMEEVDDRSRWLRKFTADVRKAVEWNHPNADAVEQKFDELRQRWADKFGESGNVKARDLPGQMTLEGL